MKPIAIKAHVLVALVRNFFTGAFLFLLICSFSQAQSTFGTFTGQVLDSSGAAVPGAQVEAKNQGTNLVTSAKTDSQGNYVIPDLAPGAYTINVTASGFGAFSSRDIILAAQRAVRLDAKLTVGSTRTEVVVTDSAATIQTENQTINSTITSKQLDDSATNLRSTEGATGDSGLFNYINLVPTGYQSSGARYSLGGGRGSEFNYSVDGISANSPAFGNYAGNLEPSFEIIDQISYAIADVKAEYGPLANVTVVTKSGTNQFHGSLFEYNRNTDLTAIDYFSTQRTSNIFNNFGGGIGGPIKKDKMFFYFVYEGTRQTQPAVLNDNVPTLKMRTGDFSELLQGASSTVIQDPYTGTPYANNVIPQNQLNQSALKYISLFLPEPNSGPADNYIGNFKGTYAQHIKHNEWDGRIDYIINPKNRLFARYYYKVDTPEVLDSGLPPSITGFRVQTRTANQLAVSDTWLLTPNLVNEAKIGFSRNDNNFGGKLQGQQIINSLGLQGVPTDTANTANIPNVSISNFTTLGQLGRAIDVENTFQYIDQLTWVHGNHTFKTGAEFKPQQFNFPYFNTFGSYSFSNQFSNFALSDFILGLPGSTSYTYNRPNQYSRLWFLNGFIQDDWKIRPNLTINYGLRYDYYSPGRDKLNAVANFNPADGALVVPTLDAYNKYVNPDFASQFPNIPIKSASQEGFPTRTLRNAFRAGFEPRVGFAWRPFGTDRTSVRGGYGLFSDELTADIFSNLYGAPFGLTKNYSNHIVAGQPILNFTNPFQGSFNAGTLSASGLNKNMISPYAQQWNLTVEQDLGFQTGLRLSYVGTHTQQLLYGRNLNQVVASTTPYNPADVAYPNYSSASYTTNGGIQNYHALTAELNRNFHHGLQFEAAYTWSKNLTDVDEVGDVEGGTYIEDSYNLRRDYGNSMFDPRSRFVSSMIWELPVGSGKWLLNRPGILNTALGGWQLSANFTAQTGQFLTATYSATYDASGTNTYGGRADQISNPNNGQHTLQHWFNAAAFAPVPQNAGRFGNAHVGTIVGPGQNALNTALFKSFTIHDNWKVRLEGSFTNVLNHPNFGNPDTNISDGTSTGTITSTTTNSFGGARSGQVAARLSF